MALKMTWKRCGFWKCFFVWYWSKIEQHFVRDSGWRV